MPAASWTWPLQLSSPHSVGRWVLASEPVQDLGLGLGSSWQQEDFQVVTVGARWGQVCCWDMLPIQLGKEHG